MKQNVLPPLRFHDVIFMVPGRVLKKLAQTEKGKKKEDQLRQNLKVLI